LPGDPHRDREHLAAHADLERLLDRDALDVFSRALAADTVDAIGPPLVQTVFTGGPDTLLPHTNRPARVDRSGRTD
jgi:hypothetical protein